jgi:hypothetical protein
MDFPLFGKDFNPLIKSRFLIIFFDFQKYHVFGHNTSSNTTTGMNRWTNKDDMHRDMIIVFHYTMKKIHDAVDSKLEKKKWTQSNQGHILPFL